MKLFVLAVTVLTLASASLASAQSTLTNEAGPRLGLSITPDQFVMGGQLQLPLSAQGFAIAPSLELGVGDSQTVFQMNGDLLYHFADAGPRWNPYVGAGMALAFFDFNSDRGNGSETNVGVNLIGGLRFHQKSGSQLFTELRLGLGDVPDVKMLVGWNFPI